MPHFSESTRTICHPRAPPGQSVALLLPLLGDFPGETLLWFHRAQPLVFLSFQHHWGRWKNDHNTLLLLPARHEVCFLILQSGLLICFDQWKWHVRVCHLRAYDLTGLATSALVALFPTHRWSWANLLHAETLHGKRPHEFQPNPYKPAAPADRVWAQLMSAKSSPDQKNWNWWLKTIES